MINQKYQGISSLSHSLKMQINKVICEVCEQCAGLNGTHEMHPCPLQQKVNNDDSNFCNCCELCAKDCDES